MDRGFKDILIQGIHTDSKYYFMIFFFDRNSLSLDIMVYQYAEVVSQ